MQTLDSFSKLRDLPILAETRELPAAIEKGMRKKKWKRSK
jgi:hypothetical protein